LQFGANLLFAHGLAARDEDARRALLDLRDEVGDAGGADEKGGADDRNDPLFHLLCSLQLLSAGASSSSSV
jgi:hypothetical protein